MKSERRSDSHFLKVPQNEGSGRFFYRGFVVSEWVLSTNFRFIRYCKQGIITMYVHIKKHDLNNRNTKIQRAKVAIIYMD